MCQEPTIKKTDTFLQDTIKTSTTKVSIFLANILAHNFLNVPCSFDMATVGDHASWFTDPWFLGLLLEETLLMLSWFFFHFITFTENYIPMIIDRMCIFEFLRFEWSALACRCSNNTHKQNTYYKLATDSVHTWPKLFSYTKMLPITAKETSD